MALILVLIFVLVLICWLLDRSLNGKSINDLEGGEF